MGRSNCRWRGDGIVAQQLYASANAHATARHPVQCPATWFALEDAYLALLAKAPQVLDIYRDNALNDFIEALDDLPRCRPELPRLVRAVT